MNTATANLIDRKADFRVAVLDDDDAQMWVDARTLDPARLTACQGEAPDITDAAVFHYARTGELLHAERVETWLMHYVGAYADTSDGLRDTLAKLIGAMPIPGVDNSLTGQERLDAWSVQWALFDQVQPWFPFTTNYSWLVDHIDLELDDFDADDEATA